MVEPRYDRRAFLARAGILGIAAATPLSLGAETAAARRLTAEDVADLLRPGLQRLSRETIAALAVFVVPGNDRLSRLQRRSTRRPGALAADADEMTMDTLDRYIALPDRLYLPVGVAALREMGGIPGVRLPRSAWRFGDSQLELLDEALGRLLTAHNDATAPASPLIALLLNLEASLLVRRSLWRTGSVAPFARLRWREKARVFRDLESREPLVIRTVRDTLPRRTDREDLLAEFNHLLKFISGALLAVPALGAFSEYHVFDPRDDTTRKRPLGWELTDYLPGRKSAVEGHDALIGYYRGQQ